MTITQKINDLDERLAGARRQHGAADYMSPRYQEAVRIIEATTRKLRKMRNRK